MKRISLKFKLTVGITLIAAVIAGLAAGIIIGGGRMIAEDRLKRPLREAVLSAAKAIDGEKKLPSRLASENENITFVIYTKKGERLLGAPPEGVTVQPTPDSKRYGTVTGENGKVYFLFDKKCDIGGKKQVYLRGYTEYPDRDAVSADIRRTAYVAVPSAVLVFAVLTYLLARNLLSPISKLSSATNAIIDGSDLSKKIPYPESRDEIYGLTKTVNAMLERLDRSFENEKQFISDASHELRTPTAVILAQCELISTSKTEPTGDEYRQAIETIGRQAGRMKQLVLELLELSRIDRGKVEKNFEEDDLSRLVMLVCDEQRELHADSGITLDSSEVDPQIRAQINSSLMIRLVTNLVSNAYQYGKKGGHIKVSLSVEKQFNRKPVARITVSDDGKGISKEDLPKIWERFYRADNSRTDTGSSGLGLTMVKWIAGYHNGSVTVESTLGKGSRFTADIPLRQQEVRQDEK